MSGEPRLWEPLGSEVEGHQDAREHVACDATLLVSSSSAKLPKS